MSPRTDPTPESAGGSTRLRPFRNLLGRLALFVASSAMCLGLAEWGVRWRYPEYGVPVFTTRLFTEFDPVLGWRKIPGFRGTHVQPEYTVVEAFNSRGLRAPEIPYEKPAGQYRVLVLGDSFAEGYTVDFADLFSERLKHALQQRLNRDVEVINAGTGGYSTDQEMLLFESEGRKYQPDLVILMYCPNDGPMNSRSYYASKERGQKPMFALEHGELRQVATPKKTWDQAEESARDQGRHAHPYQQRFVPWKPETWYVMRWFEHASAALAQRKRMDGLPGTVEQAPAAPAAPGTYRGSVKEWELTEALIGRLAEGAHSCGAGFVLFSIPEKRDVHGGGKPDGAVEQNLAEVARRRAFPWIPATDVFRAQAASWNERLYWKDDSHWTPAGNRLAADLLLNWILAHARDAHLPAAT